MLQVTRGAPAWRGVLPMLPGRDLGMDASCSVFAAAAMSPGLGVSLDLAGGLDLVSGPVRLPRLGFASVAALGAAAAAIVRCRRVTCEADSAAADLARAATERAGTPQGVEAARQQRAELDESFGVIEHRSDPRQPHHRFALLLNTRCSGGGGGAAPDAEEEESVAPSMVALAQPPADEEGWQCLAADCAAAPAAAPLGAAVEAEALLAGDQLEAQLRYLLGVQRVPRLTELEGYRVYDVATSGYHAEQTAGVGSGRLALVRQGRHGALSLMIVAIDERTILVRATC